MTDARTGHGDNAELQKAIQEGRFAQENLRFSILRTLPKTLTMTVVVDHKSQYKDKLGTRAFELNLNGRPRDIGDFRVLQTMDNSGPGKNRSPCCPTSGGIQHDQAHS